MFGKHDARLLLLVLVVGAAMVVASCSSQGSNGGDASDDSTAADTQGEDTAGLDTAGLDTTGLDTADTAPPEDTGTDVATGDMVPVTINLNVITPTNYAGHLYTLFRASFGAGSKMSRMHIYARFCSDAACANPVGLVQAEIDGTDADGYTLLSTAGNDGTGFHTAIVIPEAPLGASYMQLVGDTQASQDWGKGSCTSLADCPGDVDVLQVAVTSVTMNNDNTDGIDKNPPAATLPVTVDAANQTIEIEDTVFLGHIVFSGEEIWTPAPADSGTLLAAMLGDAGAWRNYIALIELADASGNSAAVSADSYVLQDAGADFDGDVCGMVRGGDTLYTIALDLDGAKVFPLDGNTGLQTATDPIVTIPHPAADTWTFPCRGVFANRGGKDHLYLIQFKGAGALDTSNPHPLTHINLTDATFDETSADALSGMALRGLAINQAGDTLFAADMSWSQDANNNTVGFDRIVPIPLDADGSIGPIDSGAIEVTDVTSDDTCGSTNNWPTGIATVAVGGAEKLLLGHDLGVAVYDPATLAQEANLDLTGFGGIFADLLPSRDGTRLFAMPVCKTTGANSDFELPYGAGVENADKNLVAILDTTGSELTVATTTIDINGDGTLDHGIDMDFYRLKAYIRSFESTLPIPPVVFVGPQLTVGESMVFVRGSGFTSAITSSGLGQVQDVGFFSIGDGHGVIFGDYMPFFDGLSAETGRGAAIWGYDVFPGQGSSVGWLEYLPAP